MKSRPLNIGALNAVKASLQLALRTPVLLWAYYRLIVSVAGLMAFAEFAAAALSATLPRAVFCVAAVPLWLGFAYLACFLSASAISSMILVAMTRFRGSKISLDAARAYVSRRLARAALRDVAGAFAVVLITVFSVLPAVLLQVSSQHPDLFAHGALTVPPALRVPLEIVNIILSSLLSAYAALALRSIILYDISARAALTGAIRTLHGRVHVYFPAVSTVALLCGLIFSVEHFVGVSLMESMIFSNDVSRTQFVLLLGYVLIATFIGGVICALQTLPYIYIAECEAAQSAEPDVFPDSKALQRRSRVPSFFGVAQNIYFGLGGFLLIICAIMLFISWDTVDKNKTSTLTETNDIDVRAFGLPKVPHGFHAQSLVTTRLLHTSENVTQLLTLARGWGVLRRRLRL